MHEFRDFASDTYMFIAVMEETTDVKEKLGSGVIVVWMYVLLLAPYRVLIIPVEGPPTQSLRWSLSFLLDGSCKSM